MVEDQQFRSVLARSTPSDAAHTLYREDFRRFRRRHRRAPQSLAAEGVRTQIEVLRTYQSKLFGREYLVAYVSDAWIAKVAPGCDAIAAIATGAAAPPALVMMPASAQTRMDETTTSVLEHEVVHVNQALCGTYPRKERHEDVGDAVSAFFSIVRGEYDANRLQLTRWPNLLPASHVDDVDYWCVLRGWVDAIESAVAGVLCRPGAVPAVLDALSGHVSREFENLGVEAALGPEFVGYLRDHVGEATKVMMGRERTRDTDASVAHAKRWFERVPV